MIVTFCGHNEWCGEAVFARLRAVLCDLIAEGADTFYLGDYGHFDICAAKTVRELKSAYPHIRSVLVIPYLNREYDKDLYDEILFPPLEDVPPRFAISKRNEWMVGQADTVVSGVWRNRGGAYLTLLYAKRRKKRIICVGDDALKP